MFKKNWIRVFGLISFVIVVSFGLVSGCNDGGGNPCAGIETECPCIFSEVPANNQCWPEETTEFKTPFYGVFVSDCNLSQTFSFPDPEIISMLDTSGAGLRSCTIDMASTLPSVCREANKEVLTLTQTEFEACQCKLEQYVKVLIKLGITVLDSDSEQPLTPAEVFCPGE